MGRLRPLTRWGGGLLLGGSLLLLAGLTYFQAHPEWAVRAGEPKSEADLLFEPAGTGGSRYHLLAKPEQVVLFSRRQVLETFRDPGLGQVSVIPATAFNFQAGVWQDKTFRLFSRLSLWAVAGGLCVLAAGFRLPRS